MGRWRLSHADLESANSAVQRDFTCLVRLDANVLYVYIKLEIYIPSAHVKLISKKKNPWKRFAYSQSLPKSTMTGWILETLNVELSFLQYFIIVQREGPLYLSFTAVTKHNELSRLLIIHCNYKAVYITQHSKNRLCGYFLIFTIFKKSYCPSATYESELFFHKCTFLTMKSFCESERNLFNVREIQRLWTVIIAIKK
jgi:hypothetical protein